MLFPEEFLSRMRRLLGGEYGEFLKALGGRPLRGLRVNLLKCSAEGFRRIAPFTLEPVPFSEAGFRVGEDVSGRHPWHHAGVFYLQEPSAMAPVTAAEIRPGMRVLDLCAAPGGKSTQAAAALKGKGLLFSNEIVPQRAKILLSNLERCGVRNAAVFCEKPERLCLRFPEFFDVVLVDAPCSGEGMFRREPEAAAQWRPGLPAENAKRQLLILESAQKAVAGGGALVYSTCTFAPEENEGVIETFLKSHRDFEIERINASFGRPAMPEWAGADDKLSFARRIFPQDGGEGHFVARLRKTSGEGRKPEKPFEPVPFQPGQEKIFKEFYGGQFITGPYGVPSQAGGAVYLVPEGMPDLRGLSLLRAGVQAGFLHGGRFEPSHALYLACAENEAGNVCDFPLDSGELARFLHGEEVPAPTGLLKGYAAVKAQGFVVGFGKVSGEMLKNHYPKGLRNL